MFPARIRGTNENATGRVSGLSAVRLSQLQLRLCCSARGSRNANRYGKRSALGATEVAREVVKGTWIGEAGDGDVIMKRLYVVGVGVAFLALVVSAPRVWAQDVGDVAVVPGGDWVGSYDTEIEKVTGSNTVT